MLGMRFSEISAVVAYMMELLLSYWERSHLRAQNSAGVTIKAITGLTDV